MQLAPLLDRIGTQMPELRQVIAAATVPLAISTLKIYPSACVVMPRGTAGKNEAVNVIRQHVDDSFAVVLAVRNVQDMSGAAAAADMDELTPALRTALLGWTPAAGYSPIEYVGYQLIAHQDGLMIWSEHFKSWHFVNARSR